MSVDGSTGRELAQHHRRLIRPRIGGRSIQRDRECGSGGADGQRHGEWPACAGRTGRRGVPDQSSSNAASIPQTGGTGSVEVQRVERALYVDSGVRRELDFHQLQRERKGSATVSFTAAATTGPPRAGTLTIAGLHFSVTQSEGCTYSVSPATYATRSGRRIAARHGHGRRGLSMDGVEQRELDHGWNSRSIRAGHCDRKRGSHEWPDTNRNPDDCGPVGHRHSR